MFFREKRAPEWKGAPCCNEDPSQAMPHPLFFQPATSAHISMMPARDIVQPPPPPYNPERKPPSYNSVPQSVPTYVQVFSLSLKMKTLRCCDIPGCNECSTNWCVCQHLHGHHESGVLLSPGRIFHDGSSWCPSRGWRLLSPGQTMLT